MQLANAETLTCTNSCFKSESYLEWTYDRVIASIFAERPSFLCRVLGLQSYCYDDELLKNPVKHNAIYTYFQNGIINGLGSKQRDYSKFLRDLNPNALNFYCSNVAEVYNKSSTNLCPSILRHFNLEALNMSCGPDWSNLKLTNLDNKCIPRF